MFYLDLLIRNDKYSRYWLGGNDIENEGTWMWTDNSPSKVLSLLL